MLVLLMGMCYAGKTTCGKLLGEKMLMLSKDFSDLFKTKYGKTEYEYLNEHGSEIFAAAEKQIMSQHYENMIISLSGSAMYCTEEMNKLKEKAKVVFINVPLRIIKQRRTAAANKRRPIVYPEGIKTFDELYYQRRAIYLKYADSIITVTDNETPEQVVNRIITELYREHKP